MRPAKVAISFIGTGKYLNFLPKWYEQVKENFLPDVEKTFLVFTDGKGDFPEDIKVYEQEHLDWPYITLKRFEILQKASDVIRESDWYVFLDADLMPVKPITAEEFFDDSKPYFGVHHPCHFPATFGPEFERPCVQEPWCRKNDMQRGPGRALALRQGRYRWPTPPRPLQPRR